MTLTFAADGSYQGVPAYRFDNSAGGPLLSHQHTWDELAQAHAGFRSTVGDGFWVITEPDAVQAALQDWRTFSNRSVTALNADPQFLWIPEMLDPPLHTRWRRLLGREFAPSTVAAMEPEIREAAIAAIERLDGSDDVDVLDRFARRFPTLIFLRLMGLPEADLDQFLDWVHDILHLTFEQDPDRSRQLAAITAVNAYFRDQIAARRRTPREDLLSRAMTWEIDGEPIDDRDLEAFCILMFQAGLDTVPISIGWALYHFATHPDDRAQIVADPELIPTAVEETLRVYSFVVPARKATADVSVGGCPVKANDMVMLPLAVPNRDSARYENALEVDLHRPVSNHIAFGSGPHRCLGSHLARLELNVALEEWHRRIPEYEMVPGQALRQFGNMYAITALHLRW